MQLQDVISHFKKFFHLSYLSHAASPHLKSDVENSILNIDLRHGLLFPLQLLKSPSCVSMLECEQGCLDFGGLHLPLLFYSPTDKIRFLLLHGGGIMK